MVAPLKQKFSSRHVDDIINQGVTQRCQDQRDTLIGKLKKGCSKVNYAVEVNPEKVLDTRIILVNGIITREFHWNLTLFLAIKIQRWYKRNVVNDILIKIIPSKLFKIEKQLVFIEV